MKEKNYNRVEVVSLKEKSYSYTEQSHLDIIKIVAVV